MNGYANKTSSAYTHFAISPSNTVDLPIKPREIYCTAAGNVVIRDAHGTDITYAMDAGDRLPFGATRIMATGTTATVVGWV